MTKELTPRSLRYFKRNLLKHLQNDIDHLKVRKSFVEASISDEDSECVNSQKLQTFRAERDEFQFKCFELLQSMEDNEQKSLVERQDNILDVEKYQDKILLQREFHYDIYKENHSDYCCLWFAGTGKWACLASSASSSWYFDTRIGKCGFKNDDFDDLFE